jgi:hypothetical protein
MVLVGFSVGKVMRGGQCLLVFLGGMMRIILSWLNNFWQDDGLT